MTEGPPPQPWHLVSDERHPHSQFQKPQPNSSESAKNARLSKEHPAFPFPRAPCEAGPAFCSSASQGHRFLALPEGNGPRRAARREGAKPRMEGEGGVAHAWPAGPALSRPLRVPPCPQEAAVVYISCPKAEIQTRLLPRKGSCSHSNKCISEPQPKTEATCPSQGGGAVGAAGRERPRGPRPASLPSQPSCMLSPSLGFPTAVAQHGMQRG